MQVSYTHGQRRAQQANGHAKQEIDPQMVLRSYFVTLENDPVYTSSISTIAQHVCQLRRICLCVCVSVISVETSSGLNMHETGVCQCAHTVTQDNWMELQVLLCDMVRGSRPWA